MPVAQSKSSLKGAAVFRTHRDGLLSGHRPAEAKQTQQAVATFEEALHEAEHEDNEIVNARFYFNYGATAEQAGF